MRQKVKIAAVLVAAAIALGGSTLAVTSRLGVLSVFFHGDINAGTALVTQTGRSLSDKNFTLTIDMVPDGQKVFLLAQVDALTPLGVKILDDASDASIAPFDFALLVRDSSGTLVREKGGSSLVGEIKERRSDTSRVWRAEVGLDFPETPLPDAVYARLDWMAEDLALELPFTAAKTLVATIGATVEGTANRAGGPVILERAVLTPLTLRLDFSQQGSIYKIDRPDVPLTLRRADGSSCSLSEIASAEGWGWSASYGNDSNCASLLLRLNEVTDLSLISGMEAWGKFYPLE